MRLIAGGGLRLSKKRVPRLFREATQLKTEAATVQRSRIEPLYSEIQGYATGILFTGRGSGGKTETSVADIPSFTVSVTAVARGGVVRHSNHRQPQLFIVPREHVSFRLFREAAQLKTVGTVVRACGTKPRHAKIQEYTITLP